MAIRFRTNVAHQIALSTAGPQTNASRILRSAPVGGKIKRCFDIVFASMAIITLSPLLLLIAMLIKFSDGGPVFYRHSRIGWCSRPFDCLKFRTMVQDGNEMFLHHLQTYPEAAREWKSTRKLKSDPRITPVGAVLRELSLDELPQLINILKGEMSVVGPRPVVLDELQLYGSHASSYLDARPGLTGAWQVSGRNDVPYEVRANLDYTYVEKWSFASDIVIILKTIPAVITAKGTY